MRIIYCAVALLVLAGCKPPADSSKTEQVTGEPQAAEATAETILAGDGSLTCDCATLIPIKYRPDYPRVAATGGPGCRYLSGEMESRELRVGVNHQAHAKQFQEISARWQAKFVKIHATNSQVLEDGGQALVAVAADDMGLTRFTVAELEQPGVIATLAETLSETPAAAPSPGFPTYITGLQAGVNGACGSI